MGSFDASPSRPVRHSWYVYAITRMEVPVARDKYLEETVEKILDVAERLLVERGCEHTTMI